MCDSMCFRPLLRGLVIAVTCGLSLPAFATGAVIVTSSICQDPSDSIDTLWLDKRYGAKSIFFMEDTGAVSQMAGQTDLNDLDAIHIASHGSPNAVGPIPKAQFANYLAAAHPMTPASVYFDSCSVAVGNNTVLALVSAAYNDQVAALFGPEGDCQLVGNGVDTLADAENRWGAQSSDPQQTDTVTDNIMNVWTTSDYVDSGMTWQAACQTYAAQADVASLNTWREAVLDKFLNASKIPVGESHNYELLIGWNTGGNDFLQCGTQNGQQCP